MSADTMIICKEDDSHYEGKNHDKAFHIGETSGGEPHTKFNNWFQERFCGRPGLFAELAGVKDHNHIALTEEDIEAIKKSFVKLEHKDYINKKEFFKWLDDHIGKHISTENW